MKILLPLFKWFNREKFTFLIACIALLLGAIFPWYSLPTQALETFEKNLFLVNSGRSLAAVFAVIGFSFTFFLSINRVPRLPLWIGLIAVILFPYFIKTWCPTISFLSAAYYDQGQRVTHHVERNFTQVQAQWKQNILLEPSSPITSIFDFSIKDSRFFQMSSWDDVLTEALGYSNNFFGFISRGWVFTVIGLVTGLFALYLGLADESFDFFLKDMGKILPWFGLLFGILVFSQVLPNIINHQIDTMFAKGEYHQVLASSKTLASWYPPLSGDEQFLQRMAKAGFYENEPDLALTYFAKGLERYRLGDFLKAEDYFQRSLAIQPKRFLVRGYLATTILNEGVNYFNDSNNHKPGTAAERYEQVLKIFPAHVESLYDLMLARAVDGEFEKSASAAQQIIETLKYFQKPSFALLGQAYLHTAWASYHDGNLAKTWKQYRQSIDSSAWKESNDSSNSNQSVEAQE